MGSAALEGDQLAGWIILVIEILIFTELILCSDMKHQLV